MAIFNLLYQKLNRWSVHPHARVYLASVSFIESSVFPIPPDVMLIPMVLNKPDKVWQYAWITTFFSILGGIFGYVIGYFAFDLIGQPIIETFGYEKAYERVVQWFNQYGFWAVILAGVTPIPYKVFTLSAGLMHMALLPFIIASMIGRGLRFFLVSWLVYRYGKKVEPVMVRYLDRIGWTFLIFLFLYIIFRKYG